LEVVAAQPSQVGAKENHRSWMVAGELAGARKDSSGGGGEEGGRYSET